VGSIRQSLFFAFVSNALGIPIAAGALAIRDPALPDDRGRGDEPLVGVGDRQRGAAAPRSAVTEGSAAAGGGTAAARRAAVVAFAGRILLLRDFLRNRVFERFPLVFGAAIGASGAVLVAWWQVLVADLPAVRAIVAVAPAGLAAAAAGACAVPRLTVAARHHRLASALEPLVFAVGFSLVTLATVVAGLASASGGLALLMLALGAPPVDGVAFFRAVSPASLAVSLAALLWGFTTQGGPLDVTPVRIEISELDPALRGLRIAHVSDVHFGNGIDGGRLGEVVERVNALGADLIAVTGDLFDNDAEVVPDGARCYAGLRAPLGVYAVLGNHDGFIGREEVAAALAEHAPRIRLLRGDVVAVPAPAPLFIAGVDDPGHDWRREGALVPLERVGAAILLMHRPDAFPRAAELGFDLVLSGHFHGGQVALPVAGGRWNAASLLTRFDRGLHRCGRAALYVSRGVGYAGPRLRFASPPEIALIELA
jgi:predicted MPP superfamily phosphohydrolase